MLKELIAAVGNEAVARYLNAFGYANVSSADISIKQAQAVLGVPMSGVADDLTIKAMQMTPRCGLADTQALGRVAKWNKTNLTYHIVGYVNGLTSQEQEDAIARAFSSWEKHSQLRLYRKNSKDADIIIDASASRREEFGSAGNVLAWAYLPDGNDNQLLMKFDLAERWVLSTAGNAYEILFENVACHEGGHLFGIEHTQIKGQLMYPTYDLRIKEPQHGYDVEQIQGRYNKPTELPPVEQPQNPFTDAVINHKGKQYRIVEA